MTATRCVLGVDLGTSGCRAVAIDADRNIVAQVSVDLPASRHFDNGHSEQLPADWWCAVQRAIGAIADRVPAPIERVCIDGTSSTLLLCDHDGTPIGPALMYDDRRATEAAARIGAVAPQDSAAHGAGSALAKLLHLIATPGYEKARYALHQADWIAGMLTRRFGLSDENNALKLGYDPVARCWPDWLNRLPVPVGLLPTVTAVGTVIGEMDAVTARDLGLPRRPLVLAGTTDSNAATLAAGCEQTADAVTSLGSTLVLKVLTDGPIAASKYGVYSHRIGDLWLAGGASNTGGNVLRSHFDDSELSALSGEIDPDRETGLDYYPLLRPGERFPRNDPDLRPRITPVPESRIEFLQGMLEGIAAIEHEGYRRLADLGCPYPRRVFTSGGGAVNEAWRQIRERRLGVPVHRAAQTEAAYGAALIALGRYAGSRAISP